MRESIELMRRQMILLTRLNEGLRTLRECFQKDSSGRGVSDAVKGIERLLRDVSRLDKEQGEFLAWRDSRNMMDFVQAQPASVERDVGLRLLFQLEELQRAAQQGIAVNRELLQRSRDFVDYHINVMSQTMAADTYGPPGAEAGEAMRGRKMFDANV